MYCKINPVLNIFQQGGRISLKIFSIESIPGRINEYFPLFFDEWSIGEEDRTFHEELLAHPNGMLGLPRFYVAF